MKKKVIIFDHVTKTYNLYKNSKQHLLSIFFKRLKCKQKRRLTIYPLKLNRESVALFGHNGAGKSTILKIITEVCFPTSGRVEVDGVVGALLELNSDLTRNSREGKHIPERQYSRIVKAAD